MDVLMIGIAGGTGSGKTTITRKIAERFPQDVSVICYDNYYKIRPEPTYEERAKVNYDHPDAFDTERMIADLAALKRGEPIECPIYDYTVHNRVPDKTISIAPHRVVLAEGILLFSDPAVCNLFDIKIFVDTDADVRILRRLRRDVRDRGRSIESVMEQYLTTVKPMHEQFVEPSRHRADLIIPNLARNDVAIDVLLQKIRTHLEKDGTV